ncbi:hypothetical protein niasHT_031787 [Heterodera trifolii]|uniref:Nucleoside diphosphate kinase n=1 Tax=Heterodera trifolii TaxID=157864 RepID=A0ABD2J1J6_9BILA
MRPWTFGLVKPDGVANPIAVRWLLSAMHCEGFVITNGCRLTVTPDFAGELYSSHQGAFYYGRLIRHICSGPSVAMRMELRKLNAVQNAFDEDDDEEGCFEEHGFSSSSAFNPSTTEGQENAKKFDPLEAINRWRTLLGPSKLFANIYLSGCAEFDEIKCKNLRQMFAVSDTRNLCHGSDSLDSLCREFSLFEADMKPVERPEIELFALDDYTLTEADYQTDNRRNQDEEEDEEERGIF